MRGDLPALDDVEAVVAGFPVVPSSASGFRAGQDLEKAELHDEIFNLMTG